MDWGESYESRLWLHDQCIGVGWGVGERSYVQYTSREEHIHQYHVQGKGAVHGG